jgi:hypothetical protein
MKRKVSDVLPPDAFKGQKVVPFPKEKLVEPAVDDYGRLGELFRFRLRNGFIGQALVPEEEFDRLWHAVQQPDDFHHIFVFDSLKRRIALNLRQVVVAQFDHIVPSEGGLSEGVWVDDGQTVDIVFSASVPIVSLDVEQDAMTIEQFDKGGVDDNDLCQIDNLFYYFGMAHDGSDDVQRLRDADGAIIWLRINEIALAAVPLPLLAERPAPKRKKATRKK